MSTLYLFTGSYPFRAAQESTFLPQELAQLKHHFERVVLVPADVSGPADEFDTAYELETGYGRYMAGRLRRLALLPSALADSWFLAELRAKLHLFVRHPRCMVNAVRDALMAFMTRRWAERRWPDGAEGGAVFMTWWFLPMTIGLGRWLRECKHGNRLVTRAHGYDFYEDRHPGGYIPFRDAAMTLPDIVAPASLAGAAHMRARYPAVAARVVPSILGIDDPGVIAPASTDGVLRLVSCAWLVPVKRIELIIRALSECLIRVDWTHIGSGPLRSALASQAERDLPSNVRAIFRGYTTRDDLYGYYRDNPVDLFLNLSRSEGGNPVAVMEAIACGIPVIATRVGGNAEIVTPDMGVLVAANPSPDTVARTLESLAAQPTRLAAMRFAARAHWAARYDASANYPRFAEQILEAPRR